MPAAAGVGVVLYIDIIIRRRAHDVLERVIKASPKTYWLGHPHSTSSILESVRESISYRAVSHVLTAQVLTPYKKD